MPFISRRLDVTDNDSPSGRKSTRVDGPTSVRGLVDLPPMLHRLRKTRSLQGRTFVLFACAALFLRAVVPDGFMVERSAHSGALTIMLCTARGLVPAPHQPDQDGGESEHGAPVSAEATCAFSIALSPVVPAATPSGLIVADGHEHDFIEPRCEIVPDGYRVTRHARAPPFHS